MDRRMFLAGTTLSALALNARGAQPGEPQYLLLNRTPGLSFNVARPASFTRELFTEPRVALGDLSAGRTRWGLGFIFSYLGGATDAQLTDSLRRCLALAVETDTPVMIQLDGEQWWEGRPELWNWWDPHKPGYDPANRAHVEWTGWSADQAVKLAWRNWGRQIRVLPPPNLLSPRYRAACHAQQQLLIPLVVEWYAGLPPERKSLFAGLKLGWESSIGVNAYHYPGGNELLAKPAADDPQTGLKHTDSVARGVAALGYAAVSTAGLRREGTLTEADLVEVVRRHLEELCRQASELGVSRDKLFTHGAGWRHGERLYEAAVNRYSCPGWSCYQYARDPRRDTGLQAALALSDAPAWGAVEWLAGGQQTEAWRVALTNTLSAPRCRLLNVYNWESIRKSDTVLDAVRAYLRT